ncbi:hypothetical protein ACB098_03G167200 [Castanea mollissima]
MAYDLLVVLVLAKKKTLYVIGLGWIHLVIHFFFSRKPRNRFSNKCSTYNVSSKKKNKNGDLKTTYDELCCVLFQLLLLLVLLLSLRINTVCIGRFKREKGGERKRDEYVFCVCMM